MVSLTRGAAAVALVVLTLAAAPTVAWAQSSPYLPLDDVAYAYLDALQARGELRALSSLERPYTVRAVRAALDSLPATRANARWAQSLIGALNKHLPDGAAADSGLFSAAVVPYAIAQSSAVRELMRADEQNLVAAGAAARLLLHTGRVTAVARVYGDRRLRDDPDFRGKKDRAIAGRLEDAYVAAQWPLVELSLGRTSRRWAPPGVQGLQVGDYTYSYDHIFARLGGERIRLTSIIARLDDQRLSPDSIAQRYFTAHRVAARIKSLEIGLTESILYGGVDRGFDPALASPTNIYSISQYAENRDVNVLYGADFVWRPRWVGAIAAQFMLDDVQIDDCGLGCQEPPSYGVTVSVEGVPLAGDVRAFGSYVQLSNLAYRTVNTWERYASLEVGLGLGYSDYDEARVGLDFGRVLRVPVRAYAALRRQGSGDYRERFPTAAELPNSPTFLVSPTMRVFRVGASGAARLGDGIEVRGDVGVNQSEGATRSGTPRPTAFEGRLSVAVETSRLRMQTRLR